MRVHVEQHEPAVVREQAAALPVELGVTERCGVGGDREAAREKVVQPLNPRLAADADGRPYVAGNDQKLSQPSGVT